MSSIPWTTLDALAGHNPTDRAAQKPRWDALAGQNPTYRIEAMALWPITIPPIEHHRNRVGTLWPVTVPQIELKPWPSGTPVWSLWPVITPQEKAGVCLPRLAAVLALHPLPEPDRSIRFDRRQRQCRYLKPSAFFHLLLDALADHNPTDRASRGDL